MSVDGSYDASHYWKNDNIGDMNDMYVNVVEST